MTEHVGTPARYGVENQGIRNIHAVYWNLPAPALVEQVLSRGEGSLSTDGAVVVSTGQYTGRSPSDKFIVQNIPSKEDPIWWGKVNHPMDSGRYETLYLRLMAYLQGRDIFVQDLFAGAAPDYQIPIRVITELAWHSLFAHNLFIRPKPGLLEMFIPQCTVIHAPGFEADPETDGTASKAFIILDILNRKVIIGGTAYAGEVKKSIFSIMNFLLPVKGVLSMHCSANIGERGDSALFFGLSGTGKTTLSSDPDRALIGDDEHGWSDDGIFNFEGGCYAKTIRLRDNLEPLISRAARCFGTVLENVVIDPETRRIDFDDGRYTENTRAAYPIDCIPNRIDTGMAGHPENIFLLTADAFGVIPPLASLNRDQALYYFLSGYTSKLAGTEKDLAAQPEATFSTCFGAPFLPLHPQVYASLLGEKIDRYKTRVWLVNTGWTGGPYGQGERISLPYTRRMIFAALNHELDGIPCWTDPFFHLSIPEHCPGVPDGVLNPIKTWPDEAGYAAQARGLIEKFELNFKQFRDTVPAQVAAVGPAVR